MRDVKKEGTIQGGSSQCYLFYYFWRIKLLILFTSGVSSSFAESSCEPKIKLLTSLSFNRSNRKEISALKSSPYI